MIHSTQDEIGPSAALSRGPLERLWLAHRSRILAVLAVGIVASAIVAAVLVILSSGSEKLPKRVPVPVPVPVSAYAAPPPVEPQVLLDLPPEDAVSSNAAHPIVKAALLPISPFKAVVKDGARDRAQDCLAAAALFEAGDDAVGERAVVQTILNRVRHPAFPSTVCGVVFQGSERSTGCQFTFTCDGALARVPAASAWARARAIAGAALGGAVDASVGNATHYHANYVVPYWRDSLDKLAVIDKHIFYRWKGFWGKRESFRQAYLGNEPYIAALASLSPAHAMAPGDAAGELALPAALPTEPGAPATGLPVPGVAAAALRGNSVREVTSGGDRFYLKLDPQAFPGKYAITSLALCKGKVTCQVYGWRDEASISRALPINPQAFDALTFVYVRNPKRGVDAALWNCRQLPREDRNQCLPVDPAVLRKLTAGD